MAIGDGWGNCALSREIWDKNPGNREAYTKKHGNLQLSHQFANSFRERSELFSASLKKPVQLPEPPQPSSHEVAAKNEERVLKLICLFGHLRVPEIARGIWPSHAYPEQMAMRTLKRMEEQGDILRRKNSLGSSSFVVTSSGARKLALLNQPCRHGRDIVGVAGATFFHRTLATRYLIERLVRGDVVFGEYAIAHERAPISQEKLARIIGKVPDGLAVTQATNSKGNIVRLVDVLETEASAKPMEELKKVIRIVLARRKWLDEEYAVMVNRLVILYDESQNHAKRIMKAAEEVWAGLDFINPAEIESHIVLVPATVGFPLQWQDYREITLADYRQKVHEKTENSRDKGRER